MQVLLPVALLGKPGTSAPGECLVLSLLGGKILLTGPSRVVVVLLSAWVLVSVIVGSKILLTGFCADE